MSTPLDYAAERKRIQNALFPSYRVPLKQVGGWIRGGDPAGPRAAVDVLRDLRQRYPFAIDVGGELVLALLQAGDVDGAKSELRSLEQEFRGQLDEEIICRFGRIHREIGNTFALPEQSGPPDYRRALTQYEEAWEHYHRAYGIRAGHFPGINCAWLALLQAWANRDDRQREELLLQARKTAQTLIDNRKKWPSDLPDDDVWHPGTEGDANLILGNVAAAHECYRNALRQADKPFYKGSIGKVVKAARLALIEVGKIPPEQLQTILELFE